MHSKIVLEESKDLLGDYLLCDEINLPQILSLEELEKVSDFYKELNSPNLHNKLTTFKCLQRFADMDGIIKLRGLCNWAYIQQNTFLELVDESDKVFISKMSKVSPSTYVDLVNRKMQPSGNLKNAWIMFNHVKWIIGCTTMEYHI